VSLIRARPTTDWFHGIKYGFRRSPQALEPIYIVIAYSWRLLVLAPSFLVSYRSELWWLALNFLGLLNILSRYIGHESAQAIILREPAGPPDCGFWALVSHVDGRLVDAVFSNTWNRIFSESVEQHSVAAGTGEGVSRWALRDGLK
jgi:hypothetical protein